jgi:hypothetical protein
MIFFFLKYKFTQKKVNESKKTKIKQTIIFPKIKKKNKKKKSDHDFMVYKINEKY